MRRWLLLLILLTGCPKPGPGPGPTPTPVVHDTDWCDRAGENVARVCPSLGATPNGKPFNVFCKETQEEGEIFVNPRCVSVAKDCAEIDKCLQDPGCAQGGDACLKPKS